MATLTTNEYRTPLRIVAAISGVIVYAMLAA
jgi:hypothetical protein